MEYQNEKLEAKIKEVKAKLEEHSGDSKIKREMSNLQMQVTQHWYLIKAALKNNKY